MLISYYANKKSSAWLPSWQPSLIFFNIPIESGSIIKPCTLKHFQVTYRLHKAGYWTTLFSRTEDRWISRCLRKQKAFPFPGTVALWVFCKSREFPVFFRGRGQSYAHRHGTWNSLMKTWIWLSTPEAESCHSVNLPYTARMFSFAFTPRSISMVLIWDLNCNGEPSPKGFCLFGILTAT